MFLFHGTSFKIHKGWKAYASKTEREPKLKSSPVSSKHIQILRKDTPKLKLQKHCSVGRFS